MGSKYSALEKPHIYDMDIVSISNYNDKRISKRTKTKFVFVEALKRAVLDGLYEREITLFLSEANRLSIKVTEYVRFQNNYFSNYNTASFGVRILSVFVFPAICMRLYPNFRQH